KTVSNTHGGTATASQWVTSAAGPTPISGAGGVGPSSVNAGSYTLSETGSVPGYTNGTAYSCVKNSGAVVSGNTITLANGDRATCTITNTQNCATTSSITSNFNGTSIQPSNYIWFNANFSASGIQDGTTISFSSSTISIVNGSGTYTVNVA